MSPDVDDRSRSLAGWRVTRPEIRDLDRLRFLACLSGASSTSASASFFFFRWCEQAHEHSGGLRILRILQPQRLADGSVDFGAPDDAVN